MATYEQGRDQEYLDRLDGPISDFISRYNANPSTKNRRTIFLFPGGMGSQLKRASIPYKAGPPFSYYTVWLDCSIAFGVATDLQMQGDEDYQQHYIVPDGCVDFIDLQPYDGFIQWCQSNWIDLFVFGWDWRRDIRHTVKFFLNGFLPKFEAAVKNCNPPPLDSFYLVGHSFGGMVLKLILNEAANPYVQKLQRAITVASPFYGHGGQLHRFFKGDPDLNWTVGIFDGAHRITEIVSTLPGGYELQFLDGATYDTYKTDLANDPKGYSITSYPSTDATTGQRADPYNPVPGRPSPSTPPANVRYISNHKFSWDLLRDGLTVYQQVAAQLAQPVAAKFYNIRGVALRKGKRVNGTVVSQTWGLVPWTFNPDTDHDKITDSWGPGDGTLPAWSTRLVRLPAGHVITIEGNNIEHMVLMNDSRVQTKIAGLLGLPKKGVKPVRRRPTTKVASRAELNKFLADLRKAAAKEDTSKKREWAIRAFLGRRRPDQLQALLGRAYLDIFKSPSQKTGRPARKARAPARK